MNIFILDNNPVQAAIDLCDKHVVKMAVESAQMIASALRRHGATDIDMPLTKSGKPYRGGYPHHPCTRWAGDNVANFNWLCVHGLAICDEYSARYGKEHACRQAIMHMSKFDNYLPDDSLTPFAQAMPDEFKDRDAVVAYRTYYVNSKTFARWDRSVKPDWFVSMKGDCDD